MLSRRKFLRGAAAGIASVAIGMRLAPTTPELVTEYFRQKEAASLAYTIVEETIDEGYYGEVSQDLLRALARSITETKEQVAADVINRAFAGYTPSGEGARRAVGGGQSPAAI